MGQKLLDSLLTVEVAVTAVVSLITGVLIGKQCSASKCIDESPKEEKQEEDASDDESDLDELTTGTLDVSKYQDFKMARHTLIVLVVRTDLGMTKGKVAAQCGHATLACYKALKKSDPRVLQEWEHSGQAKVALKCDSEEKLLELQAVAHSLNLTAQSIQDAGRTQIAAGSRTVLGIGPGPVELINEVTGHLKLL
ncbi:hypothetical protein DFQ28_002522 [Apophysomyces sp. BC1034]|nr:hypothetical protein DFQ30_002882 [Apophysomyces sp. BC1015]KAG0179648.1 hypothetical protein DFQ29_001849 [Apophysomyces sp. BC1021]KAG0190080.1 hypothetical protein DFQ28_002522 [Apophysomyces sp. BC1034]